MQIVKKGVVPDSRYMHNGGMRLQIEDWGDDADMLAAYPIAKSSLVREWNTYPEAHRTFRLEMQFDSKEAAEQAFNDLVNRKTELLDYKKYMTHPEYAECV